MKVYYHSDADGRCAAGVVFRFKGGKISDYIEMDYNKSVNIDEIEQDEELIIVDFSFKPDVMKKVLKKTHNIIWVDHHTTAIDYDYGVILKGVRKVGVSGCELTYLYMKEHVRDSINPKISKEIMAIIPRGISYIGDRDTWRWQYGERTAQFCEGIRLEDCRPDSLLWQDLLNECTEEIERIMNNGSVCIQYRDMICNDYCSSYGFEAEFEGYACFVNGIKLFGSESFGVRFKEYDLCASFEFDGKNYVVSLYSEKVDVSELARKYSGGGHRGASGFVCKKLPFKKLEE